MWNTVQCAKQGRGHVKRHVPCQDATYNLYENDTQVIALADGAGSAKLSHYGAKAMVKKICLLLASCFDLFYDNDDGVVIKQQIMKELLSELELIADHYQCKMKDLASTLLFVAVKDHRMISGHIGDGVIGYLKGDQLKVLSIPDNGEFVNTTYFTTSSNVLMNMKLFKGKVDGIKGFVLMSDGSETSLYNKRNQTLVSALSKIMDMTTYITPSKIEEQLDLSFDQVVTKTTTDDCSIVMMVKDPDYCGYNALDKKGKSSLLQLDPKRSKKVITRYDVLLNSLVSDKTLRQLSAELHMKKSHLKRRLDKLIDLNLIEKDGLYYHTILIL